MRTLAEANRFIAEHLIVQGVQALNDGGGCAYRGEEGRSCAVGCLLDDATAEKWDATQGFTGIGNICADFGIQEVQDAVQIAGDPETVREFLKVWQGVHDSLPGAHFTPEYVEIRARAIAEQFNLQYGRAP